MSIPYSDLVLRYDGHLVEDVLQYLDHAGVGLVAVIQLRDGRRFWAPAHELELT